MSPQTTASPLTVTTPARKPPGTEIRRRMAALPDGSLVVANEYVPERAAILRENLAKWGYPAVCVTRGDTARFRDTPATLSPPMSPARAKE